MLSPWIILVNMGIAGFIGGATNHLAIKMLFHPRRPWTIFGKRVPFTPGLIPKRKEEIGRALGKVVGDYLVTSQGLIQLLEKPQMRDKLEAALRTLVVDWTSREQTLAQMAAGWLGEDGLEEAKRRLSAFMSDKTERGIAWFWEERGFGERKLSELIPQWSEERREQLVDQAVDLLIGELIKELMSPNGDRLLRQMTGQFLGQGGGFLGSLAGMFMDEGKTVDKIRTALVIQLESVNVRVAIGGFIRKRIIELEAMSLSRIVELLGQTDDSAAFLQEQARRLLPWRTWLDKAGEIRLHEALGPYQPKLLSYTRPAAERILALIAGNVERIMQTIELPKLVEGQVENFPVEQLEQVILSVSGKEFRAITWLGVVLGALIGLLQSTLLPVLAQWS